MTRAPSQQIDFEKEAKAFFYHTDDILQKTDTELLADWGRVIAERVEESTIQRCVALTLKMDVALTDPGIVPRLYSPKPDGEVK